MSILTWRGARQHMDYGDNSSVEPGQPVSARSARFFPRLFSPLRIGPVTIPNRIVSSGHDTVMAVDGKVSDQLIAYQQARAAGGVGLIVVQVAGIHASARYSSHVLMADDDSAVPGLARLADAVHAHGTPIFQQLFHDGRELMESPDGTLPVAYAPSPVPNERFACHAAGDAGRLRRRDDRLLRGGGRTGGQGRIRRRRGRRVARLPARLSSSTRAPICGRTPTAARRRTGSGSCARRSRPPGTAPALASPSGCGSRSARSRSRRRA